MSDTGNPMDTLLDPPAPEPRRRPVVADVPKRQRTRLAKAELILLLAVHMEQTAAQVADTAPGTRPFSEWPDDDPLRELCNTYGLGQADMARLCRALASELENDAMRRGYEEAWR